MFGIFNVCTDVKRANSLRWKLTLREKKPCHTRDLNSVSAAVNADSPEGVRAQNTHLASHAGSTKTLTCPRRSAREARPASCAGHSVGQQSVNCEVPPPLSQESQPQSDYGRAPIPGLLTATHRTLPLEMTSPQFLPHSIYGHAPTPGLSTAHWPNTSVTLPMPIQASTSFVHPPSPLFLTCAINSTLKISIVQLKKHTMLAISFPQIWAHFLQVCPVLTHLLVWEDEHADLNRSWFKWTTKKDLEFLGVKQTVLSPKATCKQHVWLCCWHLPGVAYHDDLDSLGDGVRFLPLLLRLQELSQLLKLLQWLPLIALSRHLQVHHTSLVTQWLPLIALSWHLRIHHTSQVTQRLPLIQLPQHLQAHHTSQVTQWLPLFA